MLTKGNLLATGAAALCAAAMLGAATPASASEATVVPAVPCNDWGTTTLPGDVAGAYTHGENCALDDGRVQVETWIEDTKADGMAACAQLHATYDNGATLDKWLYNGGGAGHVDYQAFVFSASVRSIWVREGLGSGGSCTDLATDGVHTIWS